MAPIAAIVVVGCPRIDMGLIRLYKQSVLSCISTTLLFLVGMQFSWPGPRGAGEQIIDSQNVWAFAPVSANAGDVSRFTHLGVVDNGGDKDKYHGTVWSYVDEKDGKFWGRPISGVDLKKKKEYPVFNDFKAFGDEKADAVGSQVWVWQFLPDKDWVPPMYVNTDLPEDDGGWVRKREWGEITDVEISERQKNPFRYGTLRVGIMYSSLNGGDRGKKDSNKHSKKRRLDATKTNNHGYTYLHPAAGCDDNRRMLGVVVVYEFDFTKNGLKIDYVTNDAIPGNEDSNGRDDLDLSVVPGNLAQNLISIVAKWAQTSSNPIVQNPNYTLQSLRSRQKGHINFMDVKLGRFDRVDGRFKGIPKFEPKWENKKSKIPNTELYHEMSDWFPMAINPSDRDGIPTVTEYTSEDGFVGGIHKLFGFNTAANGAAAPAGGHQTAWPQANITFNRLVQITPHRFRSTGLEWMRAGNNELWQQVVSYMSPPGGAAAAAPTPPPSDDDDGGDGAFADKMAFDHRTAHLATPPPSSDDVLMVGTPSNSDYDYDDSDDSDGAAAFAAKMASDQHTADSSRHERDVRATLETAKGNMSPKESRRRADNYIAQRENDDRVIHDISKKQPLKRQAGNGDGGGSSAAAASRQNPPTENTFLIHVRTPVTHRFPPGCHRPPDVLLTQIDSTKSINAIISELYARAEMPISVSKVRTTAFGGICDQDYVITDEDIWMPLRDIHAFQTKIREPYKFTIWCSWHSNENRDDSDYIKNKWSMPFDMYYKIYNQNISHVRRLHEFGQKKTYVLPVRARCKRAETNQKMDPKLAVEWYESDYLPGKWYNEFRTPVPEYKDRRERQLLQKHLAWKNRELSRQYDTYAEGSAGVYERPCDRPEQPRTDPYHRTTSEDLFEYYKLFDLSERNDAGVPTSMGDHEPKWRSGSGKSDKVSYVAWNHLLPSVLNEPQFKVYSMVNAFMLIPDDIEMLFGPIPFSKGPLNTDDYKCGRFDHGENSDDAWKYMEIMASKIVSECSWPYTQDAYIETNNRELNPDYILNMLAPALLSSALVHPDTLHTFDIIAECKPGGRIMGYITCTESTLLENSVTIHAVGANDIQMDLTNGGFSPMFDFTEGSDVNYAEKIHTSNMEPLLPTIFSTVLFKVAFDRAIWAGYKNMDLEALHYSKQSRAFAELMVHKDKLVLGAGSVPDTCVVRRLMMNPDDHIVHSECSTGSYIDEDGYMQYLPFNFIGIGLGRNWDEELENNPDIRTLNMDKTKSRIPTIALIRNYWLKGFHLYDATEQIPIGDTDRFYATLCNQTEAPGDSPCADIKPKEIWQGAPDTLLPNWYFQVPVGQVDRRAFSLNVQINKLDSCIPCAPFCGGGIKKTVQRNKGLYGCLLHTANAHKYWHGTNDPGGAVIENWERAPGQTKRGQTIPSDVDFEKAAGKEVATTPPRDNRFYCKCHCPEHDHGIPEKELLLNKAESHYGTLLMRGANTQSTLLNYIHYPGDVEIAKGGERGHGVDDGLYGWWNVTRYEGDHNQKIVTAACRREALFCSMQPRTMWGERQIGGKYQIDRQREEKCTFMSFPNIDERDNNMWLGLRGEFASIKEPTPNPRTADAYARSMDFNNLYQSRPRTKVGDKHKGKYEKLFGIEPGNEIVGLRWFQYKLKKHETGFEILRFNYEVIACTPVFNSEIGVSAGTSGFIVAFQSVPFEEWPCNNDNDLFVHGAAYIASWKPGDLGTSKYFECKTILFGDLTDNANMSLSHRRIQEGNPSNAMIGLVDSTIDGGFQQSLQAPTWRLRPLRFPNRFPNRFSGGVYDRDVNGVNPDDHYWTKTNRLQTLQEPAQLAKCLLASTTGHEECTVQISMMYRERKGDFPQGAALFKEHYHNEEGRFYDNILVNCSVKEYNVGIRFIRDYYNVCTRIKNNMFDHVGVNNGVKTIGDEQFLQMLERKKHQPLQVEDEKMFYCKMLGLPIFFDHSLL